MNKAVLYLCASKDRPEISIKAQRRMLRELAQAKGLVIVGEYADTVVSGKDEDRPGFQALLLDLRSEQRAWNHLLAFDTACIARRRAMAILFEERDCQKRSVKVVYKYIPDADPLTEMLLRSLLRAIEEWDRRTGAEPSAIARLGRGAPAINRGLEA